MGTVGADRTRGTMFEGGTSPEHGENNNNGSHNYDIEKGHANFKAASANQMQVIGR
jgi:hypothetical protein